MYTYKRGCWRFSGHTLLANGRLWMCVYLRLFPNLFPVHLLISLYPSIYVTLLLSPFSILKVIEEIVEMMENSPDPGETEEEDEEESSPCSSRNNPSLLEEIRQLSQASNNNCSYEGKIIHVTFFFNLCSFIFDTLGAVVEGVSQLTCDVNRIHSHQRNVPCTLVHVKKKKKKTFLAKVRLQLVFFLEHVTKHHEIPKVRPSIISIYIRSNKNPSYDECVDTTVRDTSICCARFLLSYSVLFLFHHLCSDDNLVSDSPPPLLSFSLIFAFSQ